MNWPILIAVAALVIVIIVFIVIKNIKDAKELKNKIQQDYRKPREEEGDVEIDESGNSKL